MAGIVGIVGAGAVGSKLARQLVVADPDLRVLLSDEDDERLQLVLGTLDSRAEAADADSVVSDADVVVVAAACGSHPALIRAAVDNGVAAVSTSDRPDDVERILELGPLALDRRTTVLAGVGFSPGLSCVLAALVAERFDQVDEIHVARAGTGGPACARQHHRALKGSARDWRDGEWIRRPGGSGRELVWFPDPVGGADCYRAALPDSRLLHPRFPD
ncbi:MAG: NAD(P)-binding domain-containing protein, partial [Acidimicrobiales bacterium]